MGTLLEVSQERQARTRMKILEDGYVRENKKGEILSERKFGEGNGKYSEENSDLLHSST